MKQLLLLTSLAAACGTSAIRPKPSGPPPRSEPAWQALRSGELLRARRAFDALLADERTREIGLAGRLRLALVGRDHKMLATMLEQLPEAPKERRLILAAALALLELEPVPAAGRPLIERACKLKGDEATELDARKVCSLAALRRRYPRLRRCLAGCGEGHSVPLSFIGPQPVVRVSINGRPPVPFVVDTGASTALLTRRYAAQIGVEAVPGTSWRVGSTGGLIETERATVELSFGGLRLADVPVVLIDLPMEGIAGLISPHHTFASSAVTLDFRRFTMTVGPGAGPQGDELARWPLHFAEGNPMVRVRVGQRPARPLTLDTGAFKTTLGVALEKLGPAFKRAGETRLAGAGGKQARAWATTGDLAAAAGQVRWTLERPTLAERPSHFADGVESFGLLGMEFFMGRRLVLDMPQRQMWVSRAARLAPWTVGSLARFAVVGTRLPHPAVLAERVVEVKQGSVVLAVTIERQGKPTQRFRIEVPDSWGARGGWLAVRPVKAFWEGHEGGVAGDPQTARIRLAALMPHFRTTGGHPKIAIDALKIGGRELACTEIALDALIGEPPQPGRFHYWECPRSPWRTARVELRRGGEVVWGFRRVE